MVGVDIVDGLSQPDEALMGAAAYDTDNEQNVVINDDAVESEGVVVLVRGESTPRAQSSRVNFLCTTSSNNDARGGRPQINRSLI